MTKDEFGSWVASARWVDTKSGGEWHHYSYRRSGSPDEMEFLRVVGMIRNYGYDGHKYGGKWRYLDFENYSYFTNGCDPFIMSLINRKNYESAEHEIRPWNGNPDLSRYVYIDSRHSESVRRWLLGIEKR